jgi:hypothetical protein
MFTFRHFQSGMIKWAGGLLAALLVAGLALAPAYAAESSAAGTPPGPVDQLLANLFQREQSWLSVQTHTLADANTIAANAQNWINTLKAQGKDTTPLETALAAFNGQVAGAQTAHDTAAGLLATHAGYDASGAVTDAAQAATTLRQGYQSLQQAHLTLVGAAADQRLAVRTWINSHS